MGSKLARLQDNQPGGIRVLSYSLLPKHLIGYVRGTPIQPDLVGVYEVVKVVLDKNGGLS